MRRADHSPRQTKPSHLPQLTFEINLISLISSTNRPLLNAHAQAQTPIWRPPQPADPQKAKTGPGSALSHKAKHAQTNQPKKPSQTAGSLDHTME